MSGPRRLSVPTPVGVVVDQQGTPATVAGREVDAIRECWLIEDRWWTDRPLRRRYYELVTTCGRNDVVFLDLDRGTWWRQR